MLGNFALRPTKVFTKNIFQTAVFLLAFHAKHLFDSLLTYV